MKHFDTSTQAKGIIINHRDPRFSLRNMAMACLLALMLLGSAPLLATLNYTMVASSTTYVALVGGTNIPDLGAGSDLTVTAPISIGFSFVFDGTTYTEFQVSDNGYIHLGNDLGTTGYGNAGGDEVIPNDFSDATAMTPGMNTTRPFIAPLWEELAMANIGGSASYLLAGTAPNRTLTIEWNKVSWRAPTGTDQISFQVVLHETTNIIDFIYQADAVALGPLPTASIGLAGITNGDYYSLSDSGPNPTASKTVNTTTINTKPATGQMYRWTPSIPTGISNNAFTEAAPVVHFDAGSNLLSWSSEFRETGLFSFEIIDMMGRPVYQQDVQVSAVGKNSWNFEVPPCAAGMYMARISGRDAFRQSKFIKP